MTDANGGITTLGYDGLGRLTSVRKPGQQASGNDSITYAYTLSAQPYTAPATPLVTTRQLRPARPVHRHPDHGRGGGEVAGNRCLRREPHLHPTPTGGRVDDVLDARGHVVTVKEYNTDGTLYAATSLGYDPADRLTTVTSPKGAKSSYGYDWTGRRVSSNDPDTGNTNVTTAFDALNRPTQRVAANRQLAGDAGHGRVYMPSVWRSSGLAPWAIRSTPGGRAPGVARVLGTFA